MSLTSPYSRGPAASLVDFPIAISCVADPEEACAISNAPGSEHVTVTDLYDRMGQTHLLWSRSLTAKAGNQHGSPIGIVCKALKGLFKAQFTGREFSMSYVYLLSTCTRCQ